jgi:hypothetical protein
VLAGSGRLRLAGWLPVAAPVTVDLTPVARMSDPILVARATGEPSEEEYEADSQLVAGTALPQVGKTLLGRSVAATGQLRRRGALLT